MTLDLYDTTLGDGAPDGRCVFALPEDGDICLPEIFPGCFRSSPSSTFYKRPEDSTLLISLVSPRIGIVVIAVFVSTLLHFFNPGRSVQWDEWKEYTWITYEDTLNSPQVFVSSSGYLRNRPDGRQRLRATVTSFLPSTDALPAKGSAYDGRGEHAPLLVAARKVEINIHVEGEDLWGSQVLMTEDNILVVPVR